MKKKKLEIASEESRSAILKASLRLFSEKGFHATSIKEIAKDAEVSEGLIYHHFESKADLLSQIISGFAAVMLKERKWTAQAQESPEEFFENLFLSVYKSISRGPFLNLFRTILLSLPSLPRKDKKMIFETIQNSVWKELESYIEHYQQISGRTDLDPYILARTFHGGIAGYVLFQDIMGGKEFIKLSEKEYGKHLSIIFSGILKKSN